jgi:hypothetical protein
MPNVSLDHLKAPHGLLLYAWKNPCPDEDRYELRRAPTRIAELIAARM